MSYSGHVEIRIGITNSAREISFESSQPAADIQSVVAQALDTEAKYFTLNDDKGNLYVVPVASLGYVEVGAENPRRVGFVA
jgi:hypothetical protein